METRYLSPIEFNGVKSALAADSNNFVSARRVYEWLGVRTEFSKWVSRRIKTYEFIRDIDYIEVFVKSDENASGRPLREILCSPIMVQQLAMVENSAKGKLVRLFYIDAVSETQKRFEIQQQLNELCMLDKSTFDKASFGSKEMLKRKDFLKKGKPLMKQLEAELQTELFLH